MCLQAVYSLATCLQTIYGLVTCLQTVYGLVTCFQTVYGLVTCLQTVYGLVTCLQTVYGLVTCFQAVYGLVTCFQTVYGLVTCFQTVYSLVTCFQTACGSVKSNDYKEERGNGVTCVNIKTVSVQNVREPVWIWMGIRLARRLGEMYDTIHRTQWSRANLSLLLPTGQPFIHNSRHTFRHTSGMGTKCRR